MLFQQQYTVNNPSEKIFKAIYFSCDTFFKPAAWFWIALEWPNESEFISWLHKPPAFLMSLLWVILLVLMGFFNECVDVTINRTWFLIHTKTSWKGTISHRTDQMPTTGFSWKSQTNISYYQNKKQLQKQSTIQLIYKRLHGSKVWSLHILPSSLGSRFTQELGLLPAFSSTYLPHITVFAGTSAIQWVCALKNVTVAHLPELCKWI